MCVPYNGQEMGQKFLRHLELPLTYSWAICYFYVMGVRNTGRVLKKQSNFVNDLPPPFKRKNHCSLWPHQLGSQLVLTLASNHTRTFWVTSFSNSNLTSPALPPLTHLRAMIKFSNNCISQWPQFTAAEGLNPRRMNRRTSSGFTLP